MSPTSGPRDAASSMHAPSPLNHGQTVKSIDRVNTRCMFRQTATATGWRAGGIKSIQPRMPHLQGGAHTPCLQHGPPAPNPTAAPRLHAPSQPPLPHCQKRCLLLWLFQGRPTTTPAPIGTFLEFWFGEGIYGRFLRRFLQQLGTGLMAVRQSDEHVTRTLFRAATNGV